MKYPNLNPAAYAGRLLTVRRRAWSVYALAFGIPFVIMGILWAICGVWPFGSKMILAHDQWHQYYPFFHDLQSRLQNGQSLLHSWTTGMGISYLSMGAYYLASPMNLPLLFLPESMALPYYTFTVLVKISLCGLFCAVFLRKVFDRCDFTVPVFSTMYALCAFIMGYYWNAIWLDTVALLPLVALGTLSLLRDRRCVLYVVSLSLSILCSYYIGLFVCIFVLLLFIGYHFVNWDDMGGFWARLFRIGLFTLLAVGLTAVLTLPAFLGLQSTSSAVNHFPEGMALNMTADKTWGGVFDAFRQVLSNTGALITPTSMEGLPNLYCGFTTLILALLYCFCRRIPLKERIFCVLLLLFFAASFIFRKLDYVWHGFHFPNMLPYRFSFLWSFVVIFMAYRAYTQLGRIRWYHVVMLAVPVIGILLCVISQQSVASWLVTLVIALLVLGALALYSRRILSRSVLVLGLCCVMLLEALSCAILGVKTVSVTSGDSYPTKGEDVRYVVAKMNEREADTVDLWRAEVATKQTLNDGTLLGYRGISHFSSAANCKVSQFLQSIGLAASVAGNRYSYQEADPFINLLLGVKYLINRDGKIINPDYFKQVDNHGQVLLLENQAYLPIGFVVDDDVLLYDATQVSGVPYERLNRLHRLMTGSDKQLYVPIDLNGVRVQGTAELVSQSASDCSFKAEADNEDSFAEIRFVMPRKGQLCIYSKSTDCGDAAFYVNDQRQYTYSDKYGYLRCFGSFSAGDLVALRFRPKAGKTGSVTFGAALFDEEVFSRTYSDLSQYSMITTMLSDTELEGAVRARDNTVLYLSIPNDPGWTLTVDGEPTRITPVGDAFIGCRLDAGLHSIRLEYEAPGFSLGLKISFVSLGVLLLLMVLALLGQLATPPLDKVAVTLADPDAAEDDGQAPPEPEEEEDEPEPEEDLPPDDVIPYEPPAAEPSMPPYRPTPAPARPAVSTDTMPYSPAPARPRDEEPLPTPEEIFGIRRDPEEEEEPLPTPEEIFGIRRDPEEEEDEIPSDADEALLRQIDALLERPSGEAPPAPAHDASDDELEARYAALDSLYADPEEDGR